MQRRVRNIAGRLTGPLMEEVEYLYTKGYVDADIVRNGVRLVAADEHRKDALLAQEKAAA